MSASLAANKTTTGFRMPTARFIIKSNQMEASSQPTNQVANFVPSANFAIARQEQQGSSSCNVGELLKLTNLKLNDEASPTSSRENLNLNLKNLNINTNNRQLTGGSTRMLLNFDERPPTPTPLNGASGSMEHEQQQISQIPVTPFTATNPPQNFTTYESLSTLSQQQQQHRDHPRFVNNNYSTTTSANYPTFVDHHHQQPQQQVFTCNEVVFASSGGGSVQGDAVAKAPTTSTTTTTTTSENTSTTNTDNQTTNLEYIELDGVRAGSTVAAVVAATTNEHQAAELSFSSITSADNQYKTSRNYTPLDSVTAQYPLLDCGVTIELSEVINEDHYRNHQHESLQQYHQGGDSSLKNSPYKQHHNQTTTAEQQEQILLLQQQDSGHAISCIDSVGSVGYNETSQRSAAGVNCEQGGYCNSNNNYLPLHQQHSRYISDSDNNLRSFSSNYHHHHHNYNQYSSYTNQDHHNDDNNNNQQQQQQQQQPQHYSQLNSELFNSEPDLKLCEWEGCEYTFSDMQEFVKHLEDKHVNQAPREKNRYFCLWSNCKRNEQEFNARYKLLIHMRVHSGEKPYPCNNENCKKSFSRLENLKIHVRSHTGEKPYKCNFSNCSKSFTNSSDRIKHHKTHRDPKPYSCNFNSCVKRYTDPSSLRKHLRTHKARTSGATCSGAETMGVVAANPSLQVSGLPSDYDPNLFLDLGSPLQHHHHHQSSTETTPCSYTPSLALNPSSSGQFIDPNESYIYNSHSHSRDSSGTISNVNQATGSEHSTYYQNYHNQQISTNHNQDLHYQQQHHNHDNSNLQQQHLQFSRSWCAGYTASRPSNASGSNPSLTSELSSNHVHWNQANPGNSTNSALDPSSRWFSSQSVVYGSPPRYTTANKVILEQHENLMRSLPHTSSSGTLNRGPFGGQQRAIRGHLRSQIESSNQNRSNAHAQAGGRGIEEDREQVARENNNNNNQKRFSRANYSIDQMAQ